MKIYRKNIIKIFVTIYTLTLLSCSSAKPPVDSDGRPLIIKSGTLDCDMVETTPVVFKGKVYRFEYVRQNYWANHTGDSYFRFIDRETGEATKSFAKGFHFGSAFVNIDSVYVTAVNVPDGERVYIFSSNDLENWKCRLALDLPGYGIFNTSLAKAENRYVMMFEIGKPEEEAGVRFTAHFATSADLVKWEVLSSDHNYSKDRYTAPHCLRYLDGYYYDFYLENYNGYEMRVVRSRDLITWEASPLNPVLKASPEDKKIAGSKMDETMIQRVAKAVDCNNSDIDFCEFNGSLVINYSWGNQLGEEFLAEASYKGTLVQFIKGWFPN